LDPHMDRMLGRAEVLECWICRDPSPEPLVQPCQCRGSMGGVHASCVEAWVEYHRRNSFQGADAPCCPVCRYPYGGQNTQPGPKVLFRHLTRCFGQQVLLTLSEALRFVVLGTLLVHFCRRPLRPDLSEKNDWWRSFWSRPAWFASPDRMEPTTETFVAGNKIAGILLCLFLFHTLAVLLVSLPPNRTPPTWLMAQRFYTSDTWRLARHVAELLATVLLLGGRCVYGDLPFTCFLPVGLLAFLPICQLLLWYRPTECCREAALMLGCLMSAPLLLALELGQLAWQCRYRFFNVKDGPMHLLIALIACPIALLRTSLTPALILFTAHSAVMLLCLLGRCCCQLSLRLSFLRRWLATDCFCGCCTFLCRRPSIDAELPDGRPQTVAIREWRPGNTWFYAVLVALEAFSLAVEQKWITLLLLLLALRALQRAAVEPPPPMPRNGIGSLLLQGPMWWCSLLVAGEASGLLLREVGPPRDQHDARSVSLVSLTWLLLLVSLSCSVNWSRCCSGYRRWQRRNSTFVLTLAPDHGQ